MATSVDDVRAVMRRREESFHRAMRTAEGVELLRALEDEFYDCDLMGKTPEETAFKLGAREVVVFLRRMRVKAML